MISNRLTKENAKNRGILLCDSAEIQFFTPHGTMSGAGLPLGRGIPAVLRPPGGEQGNPKASLNGASRRPAEPCILERSEKIRKGGKAAGVANGALADVSG